VKVADAAPAVVTVPALDFLASAHRAKALEAVVEDVLRRSVLGSGFVVAKERNGDGRAGVIAVEGCGRGRECNVWVVRVAWVWIFDGLGDLAVGLGIRASEAVVVAVIVVCI